MVAQHRLKKQELLMKSSSLVDLRLSTSNCGVDAPEPLESIIRDFNHFQHVNYSRA